MRMGMFSGVALLACFLSVNGAETRHYTAKMRDGRTHSGMIRSESANSLTLRRLDGGEVSILRVDIESMTGIGISFMPEGLEARIEVEEMADLLRYLGEVE